jgi:protein-disulfide isomerase
LTIVEFSDYHCPFCESFFRESFARLEAEYIATGRVRYVFRDFPIFSLHPGAGAAASAARCAGEQDRFWEMHDLLFRNQRATRRDSLAAHARTLGLDSARFEQCLASGRYLPAIRKGLRDGSAAGVRGTPTFFLTVGEPGDTRVRVLKVVYGAQPYQQFKRYLDDVLHSFETVSSSP